MKYMTEAELIEKVQSGEFGWKDYIMHYSKELTEEYIWFCERTGLDSENENSAHVFIEAKEQELFD